MLFVSLWSLVVLVYLGLGIRFVQHTIAKALGVGLDLLTALFWFAGFIALAVLYHDGVFIDYGFDFEDVFTLCSAAKNGCGVMEAAVVFGAFEWYVCKCILKRAFLPLASFLPDTHLSLYLRTDQIFLFQGFIHRNDRAQCLGHLQEPQQVLWPANYGCSYYSMSIGHRTAHS